MTRIAIIGSGISGLSAAYILSQKYNITLFESGEKLGGHTNTITPTNGPPVDTGFIVFNDKNYPHFCKLIEKLGVESIASNMSFSYYNHRQGQGYASDLPWGLFSTPRHALSPSFYYFLSQIIRFNKIAQQAIATVEDNETIQSFLLHHGFSQRLIDEYVIPMGAAIWSSTQNDTYQFPAKTFLSFWDNHGLLQLFNRPQWRTIKHGSQSYIDAIVNQINLSHTLNHPIERIERTSQHVTLYGPSGPHTFDAVVIATHADQAYAMLQSPTPEETQTLGQWRYSKNKTVLHSSTSVLSSKRTAWASWNYARNNDDSISTTYWMNRLQSLPTTTDYFVTLNPPDSIPNNDTFYSTTYEHPLMTKTSIQTQKKLPQLNGALNTYYCGSYFGNGFHEDVIASAIAVGEALGCTF